MLHLTTFPPVWRVAGTRANNDGFVIIHCHGITILIFGRFMVSPRVVDAWTTRDRPSGKAKSMKWRSTALAILVDEETHTSVRTSFVQDLVTRGKEKGNGVLVALLELLIVAVSACELQRTRLKDLDTLASVDFEIPALIPIHAIHTGIIGVSAGAGDPNDSWEDECSNQSIQ
jgi:hypothetical protein